jgi:Mce-associated membrane protein
MTDDDADLPRARRAKTAASKAPAAKAPAAKASAAKAPASKTLVSEEAGSAEAASADSPERPKTKAERLEAKAARLRAADERRADLATARAAAGVPVRPRSKSLIAAMAVLAVLVVALGAVVAVLVPAWLHQRDVNAARVSALTAAKSYAVDFGSYDYQHLDRDFAKVAAHLTPGFKKSYLDSSTKLQPAIVQYKGKSTATVQGLAASTATTAKVSVVILLDQTVTTSQSSTPRIDRNRLQMDLVRQKGTWLIAKLLLK